MAWTAPVVADGRRSRRALRAAPGMPVLMFVIAGVMLMHGVQAPAGRIEQAQAPEIQTMTGWLRTWGAPTTMGH